MAASALSEERELAIHPIVATSVQHNTQVRDPPVLVFKEPCESG